MSIQLAPDVEAALASEAAARGVDIDGVVREALKLYQERYEKHASNVRRVVSTPRDREMAWTQQPDPRYLGQWVALDGGNVAASGADGKVVYQAARAQGINNPFMFFVAEPHPTPFVGGWLASD